MADLSSSDLVQRVRDMLNDQPYETTSTTTTTSTTVAVVDGTRWDEGAVGEWQTGTVGYEQFYVQSVSSNNLTVVRGYNGTTAETHTSGDRVVRIDRSAFSGRSIQQSITQTLNDAWPMVWKIGTVTLTYAPSTTKWYDLNLLTLGISSVKQQKNSTIADIGIFKDRYYGGVLTYIVRRDLPAALVSSGIGMTFPTGVYDPRASGANSIIVTDVRALTGTTDIPDTASLPVAEAFVYGAVARLLRAKEIARVQYGASLEASQTVGAGDRLQVSSWFDKEYRNRIEAISYRLFDLYDPDQVWG